METITQELIRERVLELVGEITDRYDTPDDQMDGLHEDIESWDWVIYNHFIHQIVLIAFDRDDHYIELVQLYAEMDVADVKQRVAYQYLFDLADIALYGGRI